MSTTEITSLGTDDGFSLIEILVSMLLIAFLAVAFAPILVQSMQTSVRNTTIATGTQLLNRELDRLRATAGTCDAVTAFGAAAVPATTDPRGVVYSPVRQVDACPAQYPGVVRVRISVAATGLAGSALTASTMFYVDSASGVTP